jgi:segregation and condensation protein A
MSEYRVSLEIYNGPLDLLLYLIRRDELDIHDIPIARITQQYVSYVELLTDLDPNLTGEFLVMAATLMEVKTRMLLPAAVIEEGHEEENELDPRADLVRQLLQYKAFKDAAGDLSTAAELHSQRLPRKPGKLDLSDQKEVDLEDVQIWDLFDAFRNVMESIGQLNRQHEVIYDDTPVELHAEDILHRLKTDGSMTFARIFEGRTRRTEVVGLFIAVLELIRLKKILAVQPDNFDEIAIELNPNPPEENEMEELGRRIEEAEQHAADEEAAREE